MRCNDCNKFVPYGEIRIDNVSAELSETTATVEFELIAPCEECDTDLKAMSFSVEVEDVVCPECGNEEDNEIETDDGQVDVEMITTTQKGNPIRNPRNYREKQVGVVEVEFTCGACGHLWKHTVRDGAEISEMEEVQ